MKERGPRRKPRVETEPGIFQQMLAKEGQVEGIVEVNVSTIKQGVEIGMHEHDHIETIKVLKGVGLFSLQFYGEENKSNLRLGPGAITVVVPGDMHAIKNLKSEDLVLLVIKTPVE